MPLLFLLRLKSYQFQMVCLCFNTTAIECFNLFIGSTFTTRNDSTGMTHTLTWRRSLSTYETNNGFSHISFNPLCASSSAVPPISPIITTTLVSSSSLNAFRTSIKFVPLTGSPPIPTAVVWPIPSSVNWCTLHKLVYLNVIPHLHDLFVNVTWHDTNFTLIGSNNTWAVRSYNTCFLAFRITFHFNHIHNWNMLCNTNS